MTPGAASLTMPMRPTGGALDQEENAMQTTSHRTAPAPSTGPPSIADARAAAARPKKPWLVLVPLTALFGFLAFISIVGSFLFSYPLGGLLGYGSGVALDVAGVLMVICALRLHQGEAGIYKLAVGVMSAEVLWSFYKVVIYGEHESSLFLAASVAAWILLRSRRLRRYVGPGAAFRSGR